MPSVRPTRVGAGPVPLRRATARRPSPGVKPRPGNPRPVGVKAPATPRPCVAQPPTRVVTSGAHERPLPWDTVPLTRAPQRAPPLAPPAHLAVAPMHWAWRGRVFWRRRGTAPELI